MEKFLDLLKLESNQLKEKISVLRKESLNLRFQRSSGQLEKTARISIVRKQIARIKTAININKNKNKNKKGKWLNYAEENIKGSGCFW